MTEIETGTGIEIGIEIEIGIGIESVEGKVQKISMSPNFI